MHLEKLPIEILLHILSYLEGRFLINVVSSVCHYFNAIINEQVIWRTWHFRRWKSRYPLCMSQEFLNANVCYIDWRKLFVHREQQMRIWEQTSPLENFDYMEHVRLDNAHYGSVDAVLLVDGILISGSRDRIMNVWRLQDLTVTEGFNMNESNLPSQQLNKYHNGWIWSLSAAKSSDGQLRIISGSWDKTAILWNVDSTGLKHDQVISVGLPVLSTSFHKSTLVIGAFDRCIRLYDIRQSVNKITTSYCGHKKTILSVKAFADNIVSASEDGHIGIFDRRADKVRFLIPIPEYGYPLCIASHDDDSLGSSHLLYVGDTKGNVFVLDMSSDFKLVSTFKLAHLKMVTGIQCSPGAIFTSSADSTIKIHQPDETFVDMASIKVPESCGITSISFSGSNILAAGSGNEVVHVWRPRA